MLYSSIEQPQLTTAKVCIQAASKLTKVAKVALHCKNCAICGKTSKIALCKIAIFRWV